MQTVWYESDGGYPMSIMMHETAMLELGWSDGQQVFGDQIWQSINANARAFCREMDTLRMQGVSVPDTTILAAMCGGDVKG